MQRWLGWMMALAVTAFGTSADATTSITLEIANPLFSPNFVLPGSLVTFQTFVTSDGGETDDAVFGAINLPAGVHSNPSGNAQVNLSTVGTAAPSWQQGALTCTTAFCVAFSQINSDGPQTVGVTNLVIATTTFVVDAGLPQGTVLQFGWRTSPTTQGLDWFGIKNATGACLIVWGDNAFGPPVPSSCTPIPEPSTATLLGVGLLALSLARRRAL